MSNIYIQEPPTSGKVLLKTTVGDIDIELWAKECPKACRNFIQLCMEGYYNGTIFHRVVKEFIVQGGDPNGDGSGGESIYGTPFKDEFHSRLRYIRRGLVGMANSDKDDNGSQFFFTMASTPELQNKNTLFGKVTGDTIYNMLKLEEAAIDHNERPMYPHKIIKADILHNPFDDIVPREIKKDKKKEKTIKEKGVKNFGLLSFGEEAEEDEQEATTYVQKNIAGKSKSTHDILDDPKLSKEVLKIKNKDKLKSDLEDELDDFEDHTKEEAERIKNKLKSSKNKKELQNKKITDNSDSEEDYLTTIEGEKKAARNKQADEIRQEILSLKKSYKVDQKKKENLIENEIDKKETKEESNELVKEYNMEREKYSNLKGKVPSKGVSREEHTLSLLNKFKNKLGSIRDRPVETQIDSVEDADIENDIKTDNWLAHTLQFETQAPILAKDASTKSDDWYDVYDPRNPINKRKRNDTKDSSKKRRV